MSQKTIIKATILTISKYTFTIVYFDQFQFFSTSSFHLLCVKILVWKSQLSLKVFRHWCPQVRQHNPLLCNIENLNPKFSSSSCCLFVLTSWHLARTWLVYLRLSPKKYCGRNPYHEYENKTLFFCWIHVDPQWRCIQGVKIECHFPGNSTLDKFG